MIPNVWVPLTTRPQLVEAFLAQDSHLVRYGGIAQPLGLFYGLMAECEHGLEPMLWVAVERGLPVHLMKLDHVAGNEPLRR